jgi:cholesterol oxidase
MQTLDNAIALRASARAGGVRLSTEQDPERPNPTFIPSPTQFAGWLPSAPAGRAELVMEASATSRRPRTSSAAR